jgi:hypothetical protein
MIDSNRSDVWYLPAGRESELRFRRGYKYSNNQLHARVKKYTKLLRHNNLSIARKCVYHTSLLHATRQAAIDWMTKIITTQEQPMDDVDYAVKL